jgi:hypothetical protein
MDDIAIFISDNPSVMLPSIRLENWEHEGTKGLQLVFEFYDKPHAGEISFHVFDNAITPFLKELTSAIHPEVHA